MEQRLRKEIKIALAEKMNEKAKQGCGDKFAGLRYQTLKNILENAQKMAKDNKWEMSDKVIYASARKEIKQLNDLLVYCKGEREEDTRYCISVAEEFLPEMVSEDEIRAFAGTLENKANIGVIMKALKEKFGESLDMKVASAIAKEVASK